MLGIIRYSVGVTSHEQTDPSGLIYMQARFYLPMYGRFSSPDPARDQHFEETQSRNIYSYCQNNPIMFTDANGEWRTGIHNQIISEAFSGRYTAEQIKIIQNASRDFDLGKGDIGKAYPNPQAVENSPWHAMTPAGGGPIEAKAATDAFVTATIDKAAQARPGAESATGDEKTKLENESLTFLGIAQHPVADSTDPAQEGSQEWSGVVDVVTAVKALVHVSKEAVISNDKLDESAKKVREVDDRVNQRVEVLRKAEEVRPQ